MVKKHRKLFLYCFVFIWVNSVFAKDTFDTLIKDNSPFWRGDLNSIILPNNNLIIASDIISYPDGIYLKEVDLKGKPLWTRTIPYERIEVNDLIQGKDSGYFILGNYNFDSSYCFIMKLDHTFDSIWLTQFNGGYYSCKMSEIKLLNPDVTSYTDIDPLVGNVIYYIETLLGYEGTLTQGKYFTSKSNYVHIVNNAIEEAEVETPKVYPNPSNGIVYVDLYEQPESIKVYNSKGQLVYSNFEYNLKTTLNLSNEKAGVYFVEVVKGNITYMIKTIIR